jgi:hypothetical protein
LDYLFTDPPYLNIEVQYGELNFVWEAWLNLSGDWLKDEVVLNPLRRKGTEEWDTRIRQALSECYRVLKPGRWISLCYHDVQPTTWTLIQNALLDVGFEIHTVTILDARQKTFKMLNMEKVFKSDLVLNCIKPRLSERGTTDEGEVRLVSTRVREIIVETLSTIAGQARDKLWDIVLRRLLARGQMAEHRFDDILAEVAFRSESGRWFLKEEFESLSEGDLKNEEKAGAALNAFVRMRCMGVSAAHASEIVLSARRFAEEGSEKEVERYVREHFIRDSKEAAQFKLGGVLKGVEFYDCLFFYLTRWLKRAGGNTPRRNLAEFLNEYLVRFKDGDRWLFRLPDENEAELLKAARQSGLGRRIRRYVAFLNGEGDFPREQIPDVKTSLAWLRHCAHFGLAEEGLILFEKGGLAAQLTRLSENEQYDADDYYQQCRRRARRAVEAQEDEETEEAYE